MQRLAQITQQVSSSSAVEQHMTAAAEDLKDLSSVPLAAPDAIFLTAALFRADKDAKKVNLGIGAYRTDEGKPYVLKSVREAEKRIAANDKLDHEYLGIAGDADFVTLAREMVFGSNSVGIKEGRIATAQSISGTGALRIAAEFVKNFLPNRTVYIPNPTWGNHPTIFGKAGVKTAYHRYWKESSRNLDIEGMLEDLRKAPNGSIVMLHACAHNPTGVDPTQEQWKQIAAVFKEKKHFPLFDSAYQGFASGDLDHDAWSIRYFVDQGFELMVCQSFAKNFGLYGERAGSISVLCRNKTVAEAVLSQLEGVVRPMYSNPPAYGARIVKTILGDAKLNALWRSELVDMSSRITKMRRALFDGLKKLGTPGNWDHILTQIGMFSYTGLSQKQCEVLRNELHVYLLLNGRISMAGINSGNVDYLAQCIDTVVRKY